MNDILRFDKPAKCFEESLLLGNGFLGAAVYGGTETERYSLNESSLWSGYPKYSVLPNSKEAFEKAKELAANGKNSEAVALLEENFQGDYSQVYLPLCNLFIESGIKNFKEYSRTLDMSKGICTVSFKDKNQFVLRESFISNPQRVLAVKIKQQNVPLTKIYLNSLLQTEITGENNKLILRGTAPVSLHNENEWFTRLAYFEDENKKGMRFKAVLCAEHNGECVNYGTHIEIKNASEITLYFSARTSFNGLNRHPYTNGAEFENICNKDIESAVKKVLKK